MDFNTEEERREWYRMIGSRGGRQTVAKHGRAHMSRIGKRGFETTTRRHFRNESHHKQWLREAGAWAYWRSTNIPMKRDRHGNPIWPETLPPHPAHSDYTEF
jgi:general stress protein YciG